MRHICQLGFLVFYVREDLVQICGVECVNIILRLRGMCIILGINNQDPAATTEHDIRLHDWQHITHAIIQSPRDLGHIDCYLREFLAVVF